jgi:hypothetical protein
MVPNIFILWEALRTEMPDYFCKVFVVWYSNPLPAVGCLKNIAVRKTKPNTIKKKYSS